ncbi:MAG: site-specific integrase, partial [Planctomycetes bacterium]|nr:site-specific integrase [Planctomycetota bacterium]
MYLFRKGKRKGSPWHVEYWIDGRRFRASTRTRDKRAAEERGRSIVREAEREAAGEHDPYRAHARRPVAEHLADFEAHLQAKRVTEHHLAERLRYVRGFFEWSRVQSLKDLDPTRADRWLTLERESGNQRTGGDLSARSVNKRRASLRQFGRWLLTSRRLGHDPFASLPVLSEEDDRRRERRAPTAEQLGALLEVAPFERSVCYVLAGTTGLRRGELAKLTWSCVDLEERTLRVRAKASKSRKEASLPLHPLALAGLSELLALRQAGENTRGPGNFARQPAGGEPTDFVLNTVPTIATLRRDLVKIGVPYVDEQGEFLDFHSLRGGFATLLARANVGLALAQKLMRHSNPALTSKVYTKFQLDDVREAVEKLDLGRGAASCP